MKIKVSNNQVGVNKILFHNEELELKPGITIVAGRNGIGKTSLLHALEHGTECENCSYCFLSYDNYNEGGHQKTSYLGFLGDTDKVIRNISSSEGENIFNNFGDFCMKMGNFIRNHADKPIIIGIDAVDSGLDIDGIEQIKSGLKSILEMEKDKELYFLLTANTYTLIKDMDDCLDVYDFSHRSFKSYEDYHDFIMSQYQRDRAEADGNYE